MYGIFIYIYHKLQPNVGKIYTDGTPAICKFVSTNFFAPGNMKKKFRVTRIPAEKSKYLGRKMKVYYTL